MKPANSCTPFDRGRGFQPRDAAPDRPVPDGPGMMRHGGAIAAASARYGIAVADWLDLSTGINPNPYPAGMICPADFARLPDPSALDALIVAARQAYGAPATATVVAVPGSDLALRLLPLLLPSRRVAILSPTYGGHAEGWRAAGHAITEVETLDAAAGAGAIVLANPNNPDGRRTSPAAIIAALDTLAPDGLVLVDEAFADLEPALSVVDRIRDERLIVLRSFGKFYGLAGLRLGFAIGQGAHMNRLAALAGDWPVSGPAITVARLALADAAWQRLSRQELAGLRAGLDAILARAGLAVIGGTDLFRLVRHEKAAALHEELARRGILTRRFDARGDRLRIGLPTTEGLLRLRAALEAIGPL